MRITHFGKALWPVALGLVMLALALWVDQRLLFAAPLIFGAVLTESIHTGEFLAWEPTSLKREVVTVLSGQTLLSGAVLGQVNKGVGRVSVPSVSGTGNGTASAVYAGPDVQVGNYVVTCKTAVANGGVFSVVNPSGKALPDFTMTPGSGGATTYTSREINFTITDGSSDFIVGDSFTFVVSTTLPTVVGTGNGTISGVTLGPDAIPGNYRGQNITAITNGGTFELVGPTGNVVAVGSIVAGAGGTLVLSFQRQMNITITDASTDFVVGDYFNVAVFNQLNGGKVVAWDPTAVDGRDDFFGILLAGIDASAGDKGGVAIVRDAVVVKTALQWGASITAAQKEEAYVEMARRGIIPRDGVVLS